MKRKAENYRAIPPGAIKIDLPNTTQTTEYSCGASALLAVCSYFGVGPEDEWDFIADMKVRHWGSDPIQITTAAARYGLEVVEYRPMSDEQLVDCLGSGRPVVMMLQAWASRRPKSYRNVWNEGHWIVAIGHDRDGVYFEDPSIHGARGFIPFAKLDERWHDVEGPRNARVERLGISLWRKNVRRSAYDRFARRID
jgi:predicted double-glycine peptidase